MRSEPAASALPLTVINTNGGEPNFFNPTIKSLKGQQAASGLEKVQMGLGIKRVSLGSFSECRHFFDPQPVQQFIQELVRRALKLPHQEHAEALRVLIAVDGSYGSPKLAARR